MEKKWCERCYRKHLYYFRIGKRRFRYLCAYQQCILPDVQYSHIEFHYDYCHFKCYSGCFNKYTGYNYLQRWNSSIHCNTNKWWNGAYLSMEKEQPKCWLEQQHLQ